MTPMVRRILHMDCCKTGTEFEKTYAQYHRAAPTLPNGCSGGVVLAVESGIPRKTADKPLSRHATERVLMVGSVSGMSRANGLRQDLDAGLRQDVEDREVTHSIRQEPAIRDE